VARRAPVAPHEGDQGAGPGGQQAQDLAGLGSERDAQAQLPRPLHDRVVGDAVDADRGEGEGEIEPGGVQRRQQAGEDGDEGAELRAETCAAAALQLRIVWR
jgi:hypothetical protein